MFLKFILVPALGLLGFTPVGVAAGSVAAAFQSTFLGGYIASGSLFAICQGIAMAVWSKLLLINFDILTSSSYSRLLM